MKVINFECVFKGTKDIKAGSFERDGQEIKYGASKKIIIGFFENDKEVTLECKTNNDIFEKAKTIDTYSKILVDLDIDLSSNYPKLKLINILEV